MGKCANAQTHKSCGFACSFLFFSRLTPESDRFGTTLRTKNNACRLAAKLAGGLQGRTLVSKFYSTISHGTETQPRLSSPLLHLLGPFFCFLQHSFRDGIGMSTGTRNFISQLGKPIWQPNSVPKGHCTVLYSTVTYLRFCSRKVDNRGCCPRRRFRLSPHACW